MFRVSPGLHVQARHSYGFLLSWCSKGGGEPQAEFEDEACTSPPVAEAWCYTECRRGLRVWVMTRTMVLSRPCCRQQGRERTRARIGLELRQGQEDGKTLFKGKFGLTDDKRSSTTRSRCRWCGLLPVERVVKDEHMRLCAVLSLSWCYTELGQGRGSVQSCPFLGVTPS